MPALAGAARHRFTRSPTPARPGDAPPAHSLDPAAWWERARLLASRVGHRHAVPLTPELIHRAADLLARGYPLDVVRARCGVRRAVWSLWLEVGAAFLATGQCPKGWSRDRTRLSGVLSQLLDEADAAAHAAAIDRVTRHADEQFVPALWQLERRWPDEWAPPPKRLEVARVPSTGARIRLRWPWERGEVIDAEVRSLPAGAQSLDGGPALALPATVGQTRAEAQPAAEGAGRARSTASGRRARGARAARAAAQDATGSEPGPGGESRSGSPP